MEERSEELKKLAAIATDLELARELRHKAIEQLGKMSTHESLLVLLELVANDKLIFKERDFALKHAREIIKSSH